MLLYTISHIAEITQANMIGSSHNQSVVHLLIDSRKLLHAADTLFFAIKGNRLDGHEYIQPLYEKGVRMFVISQEIAADTYPEAVFLLVPDSIAALQKIAAHHRSNFNIPVVGITGSNGKTVIKEWLHQLLHEDIHIARSPKSYNSQVGVPLSLWQIESQHKLAIIEAGISEPDEMEKLEKMIRPTIGIFSNIGSAHSENFINIQHKVKEKLKLFLQADQLIYCSDHIEIHQAVSEFWNDQFETDRKKPDLITWSKHKDATITILQLDLQQSSTTISLTYNEKTYSFTIPYTDSASVENSIHCIVFMLLRHADESYIQARLNHLQRVAMRLEQKDGINRCTIINDTYNSDIESLQIGLDFLTQQRNKPSSVVILSDILQSGMNSTDLYQSVSTALEKNHIDRFIGIGPVLTMHKYLFEEVPYSSQFFSSTEAFLEACHESDFENEAILIKGARSFGFERISAFLEEKAHATVFEVNLDHLVHNLHTFSRSLQPDTKIMAMVKAFSYGSGSDEIARLLQFHRIDYLGVAYADEGVHLRKMGIETPIMVLNPEERSFDAIIRYQLEPEMYSLSLLKRFTQILRMHSSQERFNIHINIDTGMRRLGFEEKDIQELIDYVKASERIRVQSVFSHLAASDEAQWDDFTREQIQQFDTISRRIIQALDYPIMRHIANSSATMRFPESHYDMVRLGLGLYGILSSYQDDLKPVGKLVSTISQIKEIPAGETIGYGRVGKAVDHMRIATLAIGYADGLDRRLSNGIGQVYIQGKPASIIGNICMDMTMVDITHLEGVKEGDEVEIFGEHQSASQLAEKTGTIPYEILTGISPRVKRVYFQE